MTTLPVVFAITGASGAPYAVRLLDVLARAQVPVDLIVSSHGWRLLQTESGVADEAALRAATGGDWSSITVYDDGAIDVITAPDAFGDVKAAMDAAGLAPGFAEITLRADNDIAVEGDTAEQVKKLLAWLEDMDDVQNVSSNADLGDAA